MTEQREVARLDGAGVLAGIRWAYQSATARVLEDYSEPAGYDATWAGMTRFTLFRDRLDRVFACGRYSVRAGADASGSLDVLHAELTERDIVTMPQLPTDLVGRADLNGSPGWAWQDLRWLLASCTYGRINDLPWLRRSVTKQRVALQRGPEPNQPSLFDGVAGGELGGLEALFTTELDVTTLVVAHSQDIDHDDRELVLGLPRLNSGGGVAWHWYYDLLGTVTVTGGRRLDAVQPALIDTAPDAPVQLRRNRASGER